MTPLKKISFLLSFLLIISCTEELDFDQVEDYVFKPVLEASLTYFNVKPFQFFDEFGNQQFTIEEVTGFETFSNNFFRESVVKIIFNAEFKNQFDRDVNIQVDLLDASNNVVYAFKPIFVESNDLNPDPYEEEIIIASYPDILNTTQARVAGTIEDTGTQMDSSDPSEFQFKSSITLFVQSEL